MSNNISFLYPAKSASRVDRLILRYDDSSLQSPKLKARGVSCQSGAF